MTAWTGRVVALALCVGMLTACNDDSQSSPSSTATIALPTPTAPSSSHPRPSLRQLAWAVVLEDHFGPGFAAAPEGRSGATVFHAATPGSGPWSVSVSPVRPPQETCRVEGMDPESAEVPCVERHGVRFYDGWSAITAGVSGGRVWVSLSGRAGFPAHPRRAAWPARLQQLGSLARDPRLLDPPDRALVAEARGYPHWRRDPLCSEALSREVVPAPAPTSGTPVPATPQALAALLADRVAASSAYGEGSGSEVMGAVFLTPGDGESVSARLTTDKGAVSCDGYSACEDRDGVTIRWTLDVPKGYAKTVRLTRPVDGGFLIIEHRSRLADPTKRVFPIALDTLIDLARDDRFALTVDPALVTAGARLPLCWRLGPPTGE